MTSNDVPPQVESEINRQLDGVANRMLDRLAEQLGGKASAAAVYGAPIERDGVTVIPVAKVRWGLGGGAGRGQNRPDDRSGDGSGEGGGGGVVVSPLGYIEISDGKTEFRRITDTSLLPVIPVVLAIALSFRLVLRGIARRRRGA